MPPNTSNAQSDDRRKTHALKKEGHAEGRQTRITVALRDAGGTKGDGTREVDDEDDARFDISHQAYVFVFVSSQVMCWREKELTRTGETANSETSLADGEKLGAEGGRGVGPGFGDVVDKVPGNGDWVLFF